MVADMLRKFLFASIAIGCLFSIAYADDVANVPNFAPSSVIGHRITMSYYKATGDLTRKLGQTYYADLQDTTFYSAHLDGTDGHSGYQHYYRITGQEAVITVEHPTGPYKGWTYDMNLHFKGVGLGTFDIVDQGMVNGTMHGVFTLD